MNKLLIPCIVMLFSIPTFADSGSVADTINEYEVTAWATFTATQGCYTNCTETIGVNFLYVPPSSSNPDSLGTVVSGSMNVSASGFLGAFSAFPYYLAGGAVNGQGYIPFANDAGAPSSARDEIDLNVTNLNGIQLGTNTLNFDLFYCFSAECQAAYGELQLHPDPTSQSSSVTTVPDGDSFLPMIVTSIGAMGLAFRLKRVEV